MKYGIVGMIIISFCTLAQSQSIGVGTSVPDPNVILDIVSSDKGILIPRIADTALVSKIDGALVYHSVEKSFYYYRESKWVSIGSGIFDEDHDTYIEAQDETTKSDSITYFINNNKKLNFKENDNNDLMMEIYSDDDNIFIGQKAGLNNVALNNIGIGKFTLSENTIGVENTAVGRSSLALNLSGGRNVAMGFTALFLNTSGTFNTSVGHSSLLNNLTGHYNVAMGYTALYKNTSGINNTSVGSESLFNNLKGNNNVAIGRSAAQWNQSKSGITAIGALAFQYADSTASNGLTFNTAIGYRALRGNSNVTDNTGVNNTAIGSTSLDANTSGIANTAVGSSSLTDNTSGSSNTAVGQFSLANNITGDGNVALGYHAGANELGSNKLHISNTSSNATTSLIYGEFDTPFLALNADVSIKNELQLSTQGIKFANDTTITNTVNLKYIISTQTGFLSGAVAGEIILFAGPTPPTNWEICNGQELNRVTFVDLFNVIGTTYGNGDGSTTFNIPDMRSAIPFH